MRIPLAILGLTGIIGPLLMVREVMAVSGGDAVGALAVLAACYLWQAVGAWLAEHRGRGVPFSRETGSVWARPYARLLILVALFLPLQIVSLRATPLAWFGGWGLMGMSALLTAPLSLTLGAQFALGRRLLEIQEGAPSRAFFFQVLGAAVGGVLFAALAAPLFRAVQIALALAALNLAAGWWMGSTSHLRLANGPAAPLAAYAFSLTGIVLVALALPFGAALEENTLQRQWPGLTASDDSCQGRVIVTQTETENRVYWSGVRVFSAPDPQNERVIRQAIAAHPDPQHLLLVGGDPVGLNAALAEPLTSAHLTGPDLVLAKTCLRSAATETTDTLTDDRLELVATDARAYLSDVSGLFDVVVVDFPGPASVLLNRTYTAEFWALVREAMSPDGVLALRRWPAAGDDRCTSGVLAALSAYFALPEPSGAIDSSELLIFHPLGEPPGPDDLPQQANRDLQPQCPADRSLLAQEPSNPGQWIIRYGWLGLLMGVLLVAGWVRRDLISPLMPAFITLGGSGTLATAMVGMQRSLGQLYAGAAELLAGFAAGVAVAGGAAWLLQGLLKSRYRAVWGFAALLFQCALAWSAPLVIALLAGDALLPWVGVGLVFVAGLPVGVSLAAVGLQGRPGAAFVASCAGGAVGVSLAGVSLLSGAGLAAAGQAVAAMAALALLWLFRRA